MQKITSNQSGVRYKPSVIVYNDFCFAKKCKFYQAHNTYNYISCKLYGDTYDITSYPKSCIHLNEIKLYKQEQEKLIAWERLSE